MLVIVSRLLRRDAAGVPEVVEEALNPESIERVRPCQEKGIDEPCVRLLIDGEWISCLGTVETFVKAANLIFETDGIGEVSPPDTDRA